MSKAKARTLVSHSYGSLVSKMDISKNLFAEMGLLADPSRLDRCRKRFARRVGRQVRQIIFLLSARAPFADQPDFILTGHGLDPAVLHTMLVAICHPDTARGKQAGQLAFGPAPPWDFLPFRIGQHHFGRGGNAIGHMIFAAPADLGFREYKSDVRPSMTRYPATSPTRRSASFRRTVSSGALSHTPSATK